MSWVDPAQELAAIRRWFDARDLELELAADARAFLADRGYDPAYGARPLKRALQRYIQDPLAKMLLLGEFGPGDTIVAMRPKVIDQIAAPALGSGNLGSGDNDEQLVFIKKRHSPVAAVS